MFALAVLLFVPSAPASATSLGVKPATRAARLKIQKSFPGAKSLFVNCPPGNRIGDELGCEFRFRTSRWRKGIARVAPSSSGRGSDWRVTFLKSRAYNSGYQSCSLAGLSQHGGSTKPIKLYDFGITCFHARKFAAAVNEYEYDHSFALQRHFHEEIIMPHSQGFKLNQFTCHGHRQVIEGGPEDIYGLITGICRNRFGFGVVYEVEQFS
jgi:hypothetical protein